MGYKVVLKKRQLNNILRYIFLINVLENKV